MLQGSASPRLSLRQQLTWWPMAIQPVALVACIVYSRIDPAFFYKLQNLLEVPAPFLIGLAALLYLGRSIAQRNLLFALLGVMAAVMTLREIHDLPGLGIMKRIIYIAPCVLAGIAVLCRVRIKRELGGDPRHTSWVLAMMAAYLLAVLVGRRAFRIVPGEHEIHRSLEECAETVAHLMFLTANLVASWRSARRDASAQAADRPAAHTQPAPEAERANV